MHLSKLAASAALAVLLAAAPAPAAIINFNLTSFGADPVDLTITLDDQSMPGFLTVSGLVGDDPTGDILGLFLDVEPSLAGFDLTNDVVDVTGTLTASALGTTNLGGGNNVNGEVVNQGFTGDLAFAFGSPGIGSDDIKTFTLRLAGLLVADVSGVAARVTSVGSPGGPRSGSDKLFLPDTGFPPPTDPQAVPEPASVTLLGMTLLGFLAVAKRRRR
jgi:hypothetical protein